MRSQTAISLVLSASLAFGGAVAPGALAAGPGIVLKVGQAKDFSHIQFDGLQPRAVRRDGADLVLSFPGGELPDIAQLRVAPPRFLKTASATRAGGGVELRLTLTPDALAKIGRADGGTYVNLYADPSASTAADQTAQHAVSPIPTSGVVKLRPELKAGVLYMHFDWRAPVGAAVFRRGDAIWLVFDAKAGLDLSDAPHGLPQAAKVVDAGDQNVTAIRITAPETVQPSVTEQGGVWTLALGPTVQTPPAVVTVKADVNATPAELTAQMAGATGVFWVRDPVVGDRLAVVTALGPPKGVNEARSFVQADLLASAQGLALAPRTLDLTVRTDNDVVHIGRPEGLALSAIAAAPPPPAAAPAALDLPKAAAYPALIDFDNWSRTGEGGFLGRYNVLQQVAAEESAKGKGAPTQARLGLARFLVGSELAYEAIGVLDLMAKSNPGIMATPEFRGLRGAARAMAGRYKDAEADFSSPAVMDDPASALWRGYVSAQLGDYAGARQSFASGLSVVQRFSPRWRAKFITAAGETELGLNDLVGAQRDLEAAQAIQPDGVDAQRLRLDQGRLLEAQGHPDQALPVYDSAAQGDYPGVAVSALLHAVEIRQGLNQIAPNDVANMLSSIRFRWRGDATELEAARALGRLYISQGRYREALEVLRASSKTSTDLAASSGIQGDLGAAFRNLFLDGGADGLPPLQSLALFLDFKDLTPVGADGDLMVRRLARRLVDVDLLDQAAELLKYQADNRLDGVPRAQVDTDLATIELMNRQPEAALDALNSSRSTLLPNDLQARRRMIQAQAMSALGRYDDALELLAKDSSPDAMAVRALAAWGKHDWPAAGRLLEVALGKRYQSATPLTADEQDQLLRAAVAYSLAGDDGSLGRLRGRYTKFVDTAAQPNALRVAMAGAREEVAAIDYAKGGPDTDAFAGWVKAMKAKLLSSPTLSKG